MSSGGTLIHPETNKGSYILIGTITMDYQTSASLFESNLDF
jgi:hypothetical protein